MNIYENKNLTDILKNNTYPGRGIVIGKTADGKKACIAYFIMGRSANSRNRVFTEKDTSVYTEPFDVSKVEDPSLIIYRAIAHYENKLIVTNGDQTDTIYDGLVAGNCFRGALKTREFEPDAPNLTPRISGMLTFADQAFTYQMSILKSADAEGTACNRYTYDYAPLNGVGHFIHTYEVNENPLPTFQGEPRRVAVPADVKGWAEDIWTSLNEENKISLYVRAIDLADGTVENYMYNKNC